MTKYIVVVIIYECCIYYFIVTIPTVMACSQDREGVHRTSIELALEASLPPSDSSSTSSSDDSTDAKAHGVDLDTLAVCSLLLLALRVCYMLPFTLLCLRVCCSQTMTLISMLAGWTLSYLESTKQCHNGHGIITS